jgi:hypothetical protein
MPKESRAEFISSYNSLSRKRCLDVLFYFPDYIEKQKEGYPLRTKEELEIISGNYSKEREGSKSGGITFEEINKEQGKKSPIIKLKMSTFRKYIQNSILPKSIGYTNVGNKRMALFPNDIITHINFLYYCYQVADIKSLKALESIENAATITYLEAIEARSEQVTIDLDVSNYCGAGDPGILDVVREVFTNKPEEKEKIIKMIEGIYARFNKDMDELKNYLDDHTF